MAYRTTQQLIYQGPPALAGVLAQGLEDEGVDVDYEPPLETRDFGTALAIASVVLAATGNLGDIFTAVRKFRQRFGKSGAEVRMLDDRGGVEERLRKLDDLHAEQVISDQEYEDQRARILGEI